MGDLKARNTEPLFKYQDHELDLDEYRDNEKRVRDALYLLASNVDPAIRTDIVDCATPADA